MAYCQIIHQNKTPNFIADSYIKTIKTNYNVSQREQVGRTANKWIDIVNKQCALSGYSENFKFILLDFL